MISSIRLTSEVSFLAITHGMDEQTWQKIQNLHSTQVNRIVTEYKRATNNITNLKGINRTKQEQVEEMERLSAEYQAICGRIIGFESQLMQLTSKIDEELNKVSLQTEINCFMIDCLKSDTMVPYFKA